MRTFLLAAVAAAAVATPAVARDNSPYVGIEGGVMLPRDTTYDLDADFPVSTTPGVPSGLTHLTDAVDVSYKTGYDLDIIGGYDFGMFRLEGELGYKRAGIKNFDFDQNFLLAAGEALGTPAPLSNSDQDFGGHVTVLSGMANAMLDFGDEEWGGV